MISVDIHSILPGKCIWCGKEKDEVITLAFSDKSFSGPMCFADFRKALTMKAASANDPIEPKPALIAKPAGNSTALTK